jgi:phage shock protein C
MSGRRLYRSSGNRILAGICGGIGEHFEIDPTIVRIIFVLLAIWGGIGIILYIIGLVIIPDRTSKAEESFSDVNPSDSGKKKVENEKEDHEYHGRHHRSGEYTLGVLIILFGLFFLFRNFLPWLSYQFFWPVILIFIGLLLLFSNVKKGEK